MIRPLYCFVNIVIHKIRFVNQNNKKIKTPQLERFILPLVV